MPTISICAPYATWKDALSGKRISINKIKITNYSIPTLLK